MTQRRQAGFTLIELLIVVAIVGILAAIAVPSFRSYILRARTSEPIALLADIRHLQEAYRSEHGRYCSVSGSPPGPGTWAPTAAPNPPGSALVAFDGTGGDWNHLGFAPDGYIRFQYQTIAGLPTEAGPAGLAFTGTDHWYYAQARADLDGDGNLMIMEVTSTTRHIFIGDASMNPLGRGWE